MSAQRNVRGGYFFTTETDMNRDEMNTVNTNPATNNQGKTRKISHADTSSHVSALDIEFAFLARIDFVKRKENFFFFTNSILLRIQFF